MKVISRSCRSWVSCLSLSLILSSPAFAQLRELENDPNSENFQQELSDGEIAGTNPVLENYYTFDEGESDTLSWKDPMDLLSEGAAMVDTAARAGVSLLRWVLHDDPAPVPIEPYKRRQHFGGWMRDPSHETCYNTRARILIRESQRDVTMSSRCVVATGLWKDPYTGNLFESARQIQIDHMVPLKNAYISGAASWTPKHRCIYANFEKSEYHLIAASGHENMSKGDDTPADYLPPDESYVCTYLKHWMMVKLTWRLFMSDVEVKAITDAMKEHRCENAAMKISKTELRNMRVAMQDESGCENFGVPKEERVSVQSAQMAQ